MNKWILVIMATLLSGVACAIEYNVVVVDNGEALVVVTVEGEGLHTVPLPQDVVDVRVEGGLYLIKDHQLKISIGSTKKALIAYKTDHLTNKGQDKWDFAMDLAKGSDVVVNLPKNTVIHKTIPEALIESAQYKTIAWQGQNDQVKIEYSFAEGDLLAITGEVVAQEPAKSAPKTAVLVVLVALGGILLFVAGRQVVKYTKSRQAPIQELQAQTVEPMPKRSEKETILKTLSENELNVVSLLMNNNGGMKRNILEKESTIAKSSLASTLYNLERKNIVKVDKTYAVHFVQLTEWFSKL